MYSSGRFSLFCVTVFALVMTGLLVGATDALAQERSETTLSFYTSFGRNTSTPTYVGGPYIIGAVWDPSGDGGDGEIRVIFSEDLNAASIEDPSAGAGNENYDFLAHGFEWADDGNFGAVMPTEIVLLDIPSAADQRVVALRGFSAANPPQAGDSLSLRTLAHFLSAFPDSSFAVADWTGGVSSDEGVPVVSPDNTVIPLRTGPHLVSVTLSSDWYTTPLTEPDLETLTLALEFDCDVDLPDLTAVDSTLFKLTAEMLQASEEVDIDVTQPGDANTLAVSWATVGPTSEHFRWMQPGQTLYILGPAAVTATDAATANSHQQRVFVENAGPVLLGATLDMANTLWLIFNEPIDPATLDADPSVGPQYTVGFNGGGAWGTPNQVLGFNEDFTNVVKIENAYDAVANWGATDDIVPTATGPRDFQYTAPVTAAGAQLIGNGIAIIRASYDMKGTPTDYTDDNLVIVFSETFATPPDPTSDLEFVPSDWNSIFADADLHSTTSTMGPHGVLTIDNFDEYEDLDGGRLPIGMGIKLTAGATVRGNSTGASADPVYDDPVIPVVEDRVDWPTTNAFEIASECGKFYDVSGIDEMYLAFRDGGGLDYGDEWILLYTTQDGTLNQSFINDYADNATPISSFHPQSYSATHYHKCTVDISAGTTTTDGRVLVDGDEIQAMVVPANVRGSIAPFGSALVFATPFIVGPPCPPIDFSAIHDNLIHVAATLLTPGLRAFTVTGDSGAAPCGDSLLVYDDDTLTGEDHIIGRGLINAADRSFGPITLHEPAGWAGGPWQPGDIIWLRSKTLLGAISDQGGVSTCPIIVDNEGPTVMVNGNGVIPNADRFQPYQIYTKDDYINILGLIYDGTPGTPTALSDLLTITADFTDTDYYVTYTTGDSVNAIPFVGLGGDQVDNDGDWDDDYMPMGFPGNLGTSNGVMDFPEPYKDEDGNGWYTPGEEFIDVNGNGLCDAPRSANGATDPANLTYDWNLDSADEDEHGYYQISLSASAADSANVVKGFKLRDPRTDPTGMQQMGTRFDVPVILAVSDAMLDTTVVYNGINAGEEPVFLCKLDEAEPSVSKITTIRRPSGFTTDPEQQTVPGTDDFPNIYSDTDPVYNLGRFVHVEAATPSDIDVLYGLVQVETSRSGSTAWEILSVDPPGANGDQAGYPGLAGIDDDGDGLADSADVEVLAALTDPLTDGIDNDGDAYFIFDPYYDGGVNVYQRVIWYNIDEPGETYNISADENEDGMSGSATIPGEAVPVTLDGALVVSANHMAGGVYLPGTVYVPAATALGARRHATLGDDDIFATGEFTDRAYGILDGGYVDVATAYAWGDSTAQGQELRWYHLHGNENIDWEYLVQYYDMVADGETTYRLRIVPYDQAGLANADYAYPMTFTIDLTAPDDIEITNCSDGDPLTGPADFVDVQPLEAGLQIYDTGTYLVTTENEGDAVEVLIEWRHSDNDGLSWSAWGALCTDVTQPFGCYFDADALVSLSDVPPDQSWLCQFRAWGTDEFGNMTDSTEVCVFEVEVIDGDAPCTWFTKIWTQENLTVSATGDPCVDSTYWYRDVYGPIQVPVGPVIDLWANYDEEDVIRVVFEYRPVGSGGAWTMLETHTGEVVVVGGDTLSIDLTRPVAVTIDTETLGTGSYDIRVYACDIEGNCNIDTADMATITIIEGGLRAYIEEPVGTGLSRTLYAFNYIHDVQIDYVTFQFSNDEGATWTDIGVAGGSGGTRGDVLILRGTTSSYDELTGSADPDQVFDAKEKYWDADEDGMYSSRDPIVWDEDDDGFWGTADGDSVILGDMTGVDDDDSVPLAGLTAALGYYHTDADDNDLFNPGEWIFRDNGMTAPNNTLDLWTVAWDVTSLTGEYWVRSVATDQYGATDDGSTSPIPYVVYSIDVTAPEFAITRVRYMENGTLTTKIPGTDLIEVPGVTKWLELLATTTDTDIDSVLYQWSIDGGVTWNTLDINDDNDFYADIVTNGQFDEGLDEVIRDTNGNFVFDLGTDIVLSDGDNDEVDTPDGFALLPLLGEDPDSNMLDDDGDGLVNEDDDDIRGDRDEPWLFFFTDFSFLSDTNVQFRTQAWDLEGNEEVSLPVTVLIGETEGPITDVITVTDAAGNNVDVWQPVSDGTPVDIIGDDETDLTLDVFVTAEDGTEIVSMDLMWRWKEDCNPSLNPWENNWSSMTAAGWAELDLGYDWKFTLDLAQMIADVGGGTFEFYPMGTDGNGNMTEPPVNPYALRVLGNQAAIIAASSTTAVEGQEIWFTAELTPANPDATVLFYVADRVVEEEVNTSLVGQSWPYRTPTLAGTVYEGGGVTAGDHVVISINGSTTGFTYHEDEAALLALTSPTMYDWTYHAGSNAITFGAPPAASDVILVSYNTAAYTQVGTDSNEPYTCLWDATEPGAPATAFDVIALVQFGTPGDETCYTLEPMMTEGWLLPYINTTGPEVNLYMGGLLALEPDDTFWPGNSSFYTQDQIGQGTMEWKLSGVEAEVFVEKESGGTLATVELLLTDQSGTNPEQTVALTEVTETHTHVGMTFTLYETDYEFVDYAFENVVLNIDEDRDGTTDDTYAMTETSDGIWQVGDVMLPVGNTAWYTFTIDVYGDEAGTFDDPRNVDGGVSSVAVPAVPFWYAELDLPTLMGTTTGVWGVGVHVVDTEENEGFYPTHLFVYDPEEPTIDGLTATHDRFNENVDVTLHAQISDPHTFNAVTIDHVVFEYSPNYSDPDTDERVWLPVPAANLTAGYDTDRTDGWAAVAFNIPDPENDGYDNDGNGLVDEEAEGTVTMAYRVYARDDGYNRSDAAMMEFILDSTDPEAVLIQPISGEVFPYEATITLEAEITESQADLNYVLFQFDVGGGWQDVDATPEDNTDDPWVLSTQTTSTGTYLVTFYIPDYQEWIDEHDTYIRFRAMAVDNAGNEDGDAPEVLVLIDDITSPTAWITGVQSTGRPDFLSIMDPHLAIQGDGVDLRGTVADPEDWNNIASVEIQYYHATGGWTMIDVLTPDDLTAMPGDARMATFAGLDVLWDVRELEADAASYAAGVRVRTIPTDGDGNRYEPEAEDEILLVLDTTDPNVLYEPITGLYEGFTTYATYENDGVAGDQTSNVLKPDEFSKDLYFMVVSTSEDLESVTLQWRYHTDAMGAWRTWPGGGAMDYEPNLNFSYSSQTYYVWRLRVPNFVEMWEDAGLGGGRCDIRGLAMDYAGRANILHDANNNWQMWTVDVDDPLVPEAAHWADNLPDHQVIAGGAVHLQVELRDAVPDSANTDIVAAYFEYSRDGGDTWFLIEDPEGVELTGNRIDTPFAFWLAEVDWTTPTDVYWDEDMQVRVTYWDAAGNSAGPQVWDTAITVEDEIKPDLSKITLIPAEVHFVDNPDGTAGVPDFDCDAGVLDGFFIDLNDDGEFVADDDLPIDFGQDLGGGNFTLVDSADANGAVGAATNTWPRWIDENEINGENDLIVSNDVTLAARTQDPDLGIEYVEFWAQKVGSTEDPILIGVDDCAPNWDGLRAAGLGPLWQITWHTETDLDHTGAQRFPDGWYDIYVRAMDREGNYEELDADTEMARVYVDNTAPISTADADPMTAGIQMTLTVERNDFMTMYAETDNNREDDIVDFYWKRARDLNLGDAYNHPASFEAGEGVDDSDVNPDETRPYSYDWDLDKANPALVVGETYHMVTAVQDIVGNMTDHMAQFDEGRYITFTVADTKAPVATITRVARVSGNTEPIPFPADMDVVHARDFNWLEAKLLGLDSDCIQVDFMYIEDGVTPAVPVLIDGVLTADSTGLVWTLDPNWDLRTLAGKTLWVYAVGRDDVGNVDFDEETGLPAVSEPFKLYVDYDAPVLAVVEPVDGQKKCPSLFGGEVNGDEYYLLQFGLDASYTQYDVWHDQVLWQWKLSTEPEYGQGVAWSPNGVFDSETGTWTNYWAIEAVETGLYDWQLTVYDEAGNLFEGTVAEKMVVDTTDPDIANISRIVVNGEDVYTTPQPVDITVGDVITLVATVGDNEPELPDTYETGVAEVLFQVRWDGDSDWRTIGEWMPPTGTLFVEGTAQLDWNTTGLDLQEDGETVYARVVVKDEECNETEGPPWELQINDNIPARARIAGWYPCVLPHGDDRAAFVRIYAQAYSDEDIDQVQFQYHVAGSEQWIPIGIGEGEETGDPAGVDYLWYTDIDLKDSNFEVDDEITLRAIATDDQGNIDENPPEVTVRVYQYTEGLWVGMWDFMPMAYGEAALLHGPDVELIPGEGDLFEAKVHVMLTEPTQQPHVLLIRPDEPVGGECSDAEKVIMEREITPGTEGSWLGHQNMEADECGRYEVFATAMTADGNLQIYRTNLWSYEVTAELGTRGWATVTGYTVDVDTTTVYLKAMVNVPPGAGGMSCLFLSPVDPPLVNGDQERYMTMLPRTAYFIGHPTDDASFHEGFYPYVTIEYDEAALLEVFGDAANAAAREPFLTVKCWGDHDGSSGTPKIWHSMPISDVSVDTQANQITFRVDGFDATRTNSYTQPYFAIFAPKATAPVSVASFTPGSVRYGRWNYTDSDPVIVAYLNCPGPATVRTESIELWIDDVLWAATGSAWEYDARGSGVFEYTRANESGTIYQIAYRHSYRMEDQLRPGWHTLNIVYEDTTGQGNWYELPAEAAGAQFFVDATAPQISFHGGFVSSPVLKNIGGYLSPAATQNMLKVELYDAESGIYMRPDHPEWIFDVDCTDNLPPDPRHAMWQDDACGWPYATGENPQACWVEVDYGFKYDLWLVQHDHGEDEQGDIDEIEERLLLHTGTADEVIPYCTPPLYMASSEDPPAEYYTPEDVLTVGLPVMGGGLIKNGDILEVVIYSTKTIEANSDSMFIGVRVDTVYIGGQQILLYGESFMDWRSQEMHIYNYGLFDYARNRGSRFVEQRFVVDMVGPTARLVGLPPTPGEAATICIAIEDRGAGIATSGQGAPVIQLVGPDGEVVEGVEFAYSDGLWCATVEDGLGFGEYTVLVNGADLAGNQAIVRLPLVAQQATLTVTEAFITPNPVNPNDGAAVIQMTLGREAHVTAKVYDFAGDYVTTIASGHHAAGPVTIAWDGTANGAELGNGAYLIRVEAEDGNSKKGATIKAVIWRED